MLFAGFKVLDIETKIKNEIQKTLKQRNDADLILDIEGRRERVTFAMLQSYT